MLIGSMCVLGLIFVVYMMVPQGFIPRQDTGVFSGNTRGPEGLTFNELVKRQAAVAKVIQNHPAGRRPCKMLFGVTS